MVSIDNVYQKVLALANKEQRGYVTPQEFNLFADQAQMEILEQYFYDINQFSRIPGNNHEYSDILTNLEEKISLFEKYDRTATATNQWGDILLTQLFPDMYRLGMVRVKYQDQSKYYQAEEIKLSELMTYNNSPLTKKSKKRPYYTRYSTVGTYSPHRIKIYPYPTASDNVRISYVAKPITPKWGYVVIGGKALYNSDSSVSTDFELHASEESELVYRILAFAGITLEKPQLVQTAAALEQAKVQQEKQ